MYLGLFNIPISSAFVWWVSHTFILMLPVTDSVNGNYLPVGDVEFVPSHEGHQGPSCQEDPLQKHKRASRQVCCRVDSANTVHWGGGPKSPWGIEGNTGKEELSVTHWDSEC